MSHLAVEAAGWQWIKWSARLERGLSVDCGQRGGEAPAMRWPLANEWADVAMLPFPAAR